MNARKHILTIIISLSLFSWGCNKTKQITEEKPQISTSIDAPKLVVGIVIDQMRYDYIYRYWDDYSTGGFKRLIQKGFFYENHHFDYAPTYTGPGHASIYTGTTPEMHGIIANDWWDKESDTTVYCVSDTNYQGVGTSSNSGQMSPHRMLTTTITDQLKLATNNRSKTIGISLKDRGAILPAGHMADAAYWLVGKDWITSTRYMNELPQWVRNYNNENWPDKFLEKGWHLTNPIEQYDESLPDNNPFEGAYKGTLKPTFPYDLKTLAPDNYDYGILKGTPLGNQLLLDFAKRAIVNEKMGQGEFTDFLALSFSATDYVGHQFGTQAIETQDAYLQLDIQIADLLVFLDQQYGKDNYLVFFTADHGAVHAPSFMQKNKVPVKYWNPGNMVDDIKVDLNKKYGLAEWINNYSNDQIFLNLFAVDSAGIDLHEMEDYIASRVILTEGVQKVFTGYALQNTEFTKGVSDKIQNGYHQQRSGEVVVVIKPGWLQYGTRTGTSHGRPYAYDTHVPLIFYGWNIPNGHTFVESNIRDIAPTLASLLKIQMPNGCTGKPLVEVLK